MRDQVYQTTTAIEAALVARGLLSGAAFDRVRGLQSDSGERIDHIAAKLGLVGERDLAEIYAALIGSPAITPPEFPATPIAAGQLLLAFLHHARAIPLAETDMKITVAMADPFDDATIRALEFATDKTVLRRAALPADIEAALGRLYGDGRSSVDQLYAEVGTRDDEDRDADLERLKDLASEAPVIRLVNALITSAVEMGASDIHLESASAGASTGRNRKNNLATQPSILYTRSMPATQPNQPCSTRSICSKPSAPKSGAGPPSQGAGQRLDPRRSPRHHGAIAKTRTKR